MPRPNDLRPTLTPGFQTGSRMRCQWYAPQGERPHLVWQPDISPSTRNWLRMLKASAMSTTATGG